MWFEGHFLRYAPPIHPLILLMDGHFANFCPDTIGMAAEQQVVLFTLPPNTTHVSQPLDKGCFGPLKHATLSQGFSMSMDAFYDHQKYTVWISCYRYLSP